MRKLGSFLMAVGALIGVGAAVWVWAGVGAIGLPWIVSVGLLKLTIVAAVGVMGAGASFVRIAKREEQRQLHRPETLP